MIDPAQQPDGAAVPVIRRRRHRGWATLLLGLGVASCVLAAFVSIFFLALAALAATGTYAAWLGLSAAEVLDLVDDSTAPPVSPT